MKYCPYCGTALVGGAVSFCMECGKKLPIKTAECSSSQLNDNNELYQEAAESGMVSQKEKMVGSRSQKTSQKHNTREKERQVKKKWRYPELPEEEKQTIEPAKEPEQISGTNSEDGYDGYYEDVLPADEGRFSEGMDKNLIKKVIVIIGAVLLIVTLCVGMMYVL